MSMSVVTIGYEGRQLDEFIAELVDRRVEVVFDVRENAISRKPGFSKRRLGEALAAAGIEYQHLSVARATRGATGTRSAPANPQLATLFLRHLDNGIPRGPRRGRGRGRSRTVALMCFERDHASCHRSCIADRLVADNPTLRVEPV